MCYLGFSPSLSLASALSLCLPVSSIPPSLGLSPSRLWLSNTCLGVCHPFCYAASLMTLLLSISVWYSSLFPLWLSALLRVSFSPLLSPALRISASSSSSLPYPGVQTGYLGAESLLTMDAVSGGQGWAGEWQPTPLPLIHHHAGPTCSQWRGSQDLTLSRCLAPCGILITSYSLMPFP